MTSWWLASHPTIEPSSLPQHNYFIFSLELSRLSIILLIIYPLPIRNWLKSFLVISSALKSWRRIHKLLFHILWPIIIILLAAPSPIINRLINRIEIIMTILKSCIIIMLPLLVVLIFRVLLVIRRPVIVLFTTASAPIKLGLGIHVLFLRNWPIVTVVAALALAMARLMVNLLLELFFILLLEIFIFLLEIFFLLLKVVLLFWFLWITLLFLIL